MSTVAEEIKRRWKLDSLTSIDAVNILKIAPLIACILDTRFKECKFLGTGEQFKVKAALTASMCKDNDSCDTSESTESAN